MCRVCCRQRRTECPLALRLVNGSRNNGCQCESRMMGAAAMSTSPQASRARDRMPGSPLRIAVPERESRSGRRAMRSIRPGVEPASPRLGAGASPGERVVIATGPDPVTGPGHGAVPTMGAGQIIAQLAAPGNEASCRLAGPVGWSTHDAGGPAGGNVPLLFTSRVPSHHAKVPLSCDACNWKQPTPKVRRRFPQPFIALIHFRG